MKIIIYVGHPAHFHLFTQTIIQLESKKHEILITIKYKDVLEKLLKKNNIDYINLAPFGRKDNKFSIAKGFMERLIKLFIIAKKFKANLLIGSPAEIAQVGKLLNIPSLIFIKTIL